MTYIYELGMNRRTETRLIILIIVSFNICQLLITSNAQSTGTGSCYVTSVLVPNSNVAGAVANGDATNEATCEAICIQNASCRGFDWNSQNQKCFLTLFEIWIINYNATAYTDHYNLIKGPSNCIGNCSYPRWVPIVDFHASGGIGLAMLSLNECVIRCIQNATCSSFDWDPYNPDNITCWLILSYPPPPLLSARGVYHYDKACLTITGSSTMAPRETPTLTTFPIVYIPTRPSTTLPPDVLASLSTPSSSSASSTTTTVANNNSSGQNYQNQTSTGSPTGTSTTTYTTTAFNFTTSQWNVTANNFSIASSTFTSPTPIETPATDQWPLENQDQLDPFEIVPMAIKPAYIILAGIGAGCLLLVLTAIIILCQYPLNHPMEEKSTDGIETFNSSDNIVDLGFFDDPHPDFRQSGVVATEFEATTLN